MTAAEIARTPLVQAAWRRMCRDITDEEIAVMIRIGVNGDKANAMLRAYRAGRADAARATKGSPA